MNLNNENFFSRKKQKEKNLNNENLFFNVITN